MNYEDKYKGYGWIKVPTSKPMTVNDEVFVTEKHHIEETGFLILEIRKLAKLLDGK